MGAMHLHRYVHRWLLAPLIWLKMNGQTRPLAISSWIHNQFLSILQNLRRRRQCITLI